MNFFKTKIIIKKSIMIFVSMRKNEHAAVHYFFFTLNYTEQKQVAGIYRKSYKEQQKNIC